MTLKLTSVLTYCLYFADASAHLLSPAYETCHDRRTTKTAVLAAAYAPLPIAYGKLIEHSIYFPRQTKCLCLPLLIALSPLVQGQSSRNKTKRIGLEADGHEFDQVSSLTRKDKAKRSTLWVYF